MPKQLLRNLTEQILAEVARHPAGVRLDTLVRALAHRVNRRTLQRRLAEEERKVRSGALPLFTRCIVHHGPYAAYRRYLTAQSDGVAPGAHDAG